MVIAIALFGWRSWTFGDPYFTFKKQILFTISTLSKKKQELNVGSSKKFTISVRETSNPTIMRLQAREIVVAKCELVL